MKRIIAFILSAIMILCASSIGCYAEEWVVPAPDEYGFYDVGTTKIEYAVYGAEHDQALLIFTGNGGNMHGHDYNILPEMAKHYKVIVLSTRGTGNTALGTDKLTFELEAEDAAKLLDYLGIKTTYIYGFSDGGNLGIVFTLLYPERVTKLCVQSPNINIFGTKLKTQLQIMWQYFILCIECLYKTDPDFLRQREIKGMMAHQPNLQFKDLEQIQIPVLHIYAEKDMMYRTHNKRIDKHIPDCQSLMIEDATHTSTFESTETIINPALIEFFG